MPTQYNIKINYALDFYAFTLSLLGELRSRDNIYSKGKKGYTMLKRKPGVSPMVFSRHLLNKTVFLNLEDVAPDLPPLSEGVRGIVMDEELEEGYRDLEDKLYSAVKAALSKGSKALLGTLLMAV